MDLRLTALAAMTAAMTAGGACALANEALRKEAMDYFSPLPPKAPARADNPVTSEKIALGKALFFDPRLSTDGKASCAFCHDPASGGAGKARAVTGHPWQSEPRNAPSISHALLNASPTQDEPAGDRSAPVLRPIRAGIELRAFPGVALERLRSDAKLREAFAKAFGGGAAQAIDALSIAKSIEAYLSTLVTADTAFDRFMQGDDAALAIDQQIGLAAFIDKGCAACHGGPNLGGAGYEAFERDAAANGGASPAAGNGAGGPRAAPRRFRTAPLRNVALTAPYFHDGSVDRLEDAVALMASTQSGEAGRDGDVKAISAFLRSLSAGRR